MHKKTTIAHYLLTRLTELGIEHVFGLPGDYNLTFLDQILAFKALTWVGNCNELNAAYAADGYARIKGAAALVTTFGVGELSAMNGIAGSYAEYVPVVHIVGSPATTIQEEGAIMHHTFGQGDFDVFVNMFKNISSATAILNDPETAAQQIDKALACCWVKKQPVYISLPSNMVAVEINAPEKPLNLAYPASDRDSIKELTTQAAARIKQAKSPVILVDLCAIRHHMAKFILTLLDQTGIPFATMNMGKAILDESHPGFLGFYNGDYSSPGVQTRIEQSDCIISFGTLMSDFNTGEFTSNLYPDVTIEIHSHYVKLRHAMYPDVYFNAVIPALIKTLKGYRHHESVINPPIPSYQPQDKKITQQRFWENMAHYFQEGDIIIAETGTCMFGLLETRVPAHATVITQTLWGSIGYSVGALLGAALADTKRRVLLFVGDGALQLTVQELSTVLRQHLNPIVFLFNNAGYTIERIIHGDTMHYNDIQPWDYTNLPKMFGKNVVSVRVSTEPELAKALASFEHQTDKLRFIELIMDKNDCADSLKKLAKACAVMNKA